MGLTESLPTRVGFIDECGAKLSLSLYHLLGCRIPELFSNRVGISVACENMIYVQI